MIDYVWSEKYKIAKLDNIGTFLLSERECLFLSFDVFPFLASQTSHISTHDIVQNAPTSELGALYLYKIEQLVRQSILVERCNNSSLYKSLKNKPVSTFTKDSITITDESSVDSNCYSYWQELILGACNQVNDKIFDITFILIDDFLEFSQYETIGKLNRTCLIKVSGKSIWISPLFSRESPLNPVVFQTQLWKNQPARQFVKTALSNFNTTPPYTSNNQYINQFRTVLLNALSEHLQSPLFQMTMVDITTGHIAYHSVISCITHSPSLAVNIIKPITLSSNVVLYDNDGGSRVVAPEITVNSLMPLVSPITGVITHLELLDNQSDLPIKTYKTGYFKTPAYKIGMVLQPDAFVHNCMGKGVSAVQSKASALCEAIERYAAVYQGDEPIRLSRQSALNTRSFQYHDLAPYSCLQYLNFTNIKHEDSKREQAVTRYADEEIHWVMAWSLTKQENVYLPLSHCFSNIPFNDEQFGKWNSNGCAAGNTREEAILQALYELIERDAVAIWWYNEIVQPEYNLDNISDTLLKEVEETLGSDNNYWLLNLSHDLGVSVIAAIAQNKKSASYSFGFGCHLNTTLAAQRALTELCQLFSVREQNKSIFNINAIKQSAFLHPSNSNKVTPKCKRASNNIKNDIETIIELLQVQHLEVIALDYSRSNLPIKTVKITVPGLSHIWPQLGNQRLYHVPYKMGWLKAVKDEKLLRPQGLYI